MASPATNDFEYLLQTTDCSYLENAEAFGLQVMDKRFPFASGFDFYGVDGKDLAFAKEPTPDVQTFLQENPEITITNAVRKHGEERVYVDYYTLETEEDLHNPDFAGFAALDWQDFSLLYRSAVGGHAVETTVHQAIVRVDGHNDRLRITSQSLQQIANIVACANDL